jgi:hypothetical protein
LKDYFRVIEEGFESFEVVSSNRVHCIEKVSLMDCIQKVSFKLNCIQKVSLMDCIQKVSEELR